MFDENIIKETISESNSKSNSNLPKTINQHTNDNITLPKDVADNEPSLIQSNVAATDTALETKSNISSENPSKSEISSRASSSINKSRDTLNLSYNTNEINKGLNTFNITTPTQVTNISDTNTPNTQNVMSIGRVDLNNLEGEISLPNEVDVNLKHIKNEEERKNETMMNNNSNLSINKIEIEDTNDMIDAQDYEIKHEENPNSIPTLNADMNNPNETTKNEINDPETAPNSNANANGDDEMKDESDDENDLTDFDESQ